MNKFTLMTFLAILSPSMAQASSNQNSCAIQNLTEQKEQLLARFTDSNQSLIKRYAFMGRINNQTHAKELENDAAFTEEYKDLMSEDRPSPNNSGRNTPNTTFQQHSNTNLKLEIGLNRSIFAAIERLQKLQMNELQIKELEKSDDSK